MKRRRIIWLALLVAAAVAVTAGYSRSVRQGKSKPIKIERDIGHAASTPPPRVGTGYSFCFVQVNHSGGFALYGTNAIARQQ